MNAPLFRSLTLLVLASIAGGIGDASAAKGGGSSGGRGNDRSACIADHLEKARDWAEYSADPTNEPAIAHFAERLSIDCKLGSTLAYCAVKTAVDALGFNADDIVRDCRDQVAKNAGTFGTF